MKRLALAGLLALAVTFGAQQKASAYGGFGFSCSGSCSFNFSCGFGCGCGGCCGWPCTYSCFNNCGCPYYYPCFNYCAVPPCNYGGYAPYGGYGYGGAPYYPAYAAQSYGGDYYAGASQAPQAAQTVNAPQATTVPVGYYPYSYGNGYQTPSYWYGR